MLRWLSRFWSLPWPLKGAIAGGWILAAALAIVAALALSDDSDKASPAALAHPSSTATATSATMTPPPTATIQPFTALPDRQDCRIIRGTPYRSETERAWFLAYCFSAQLPTSEGFRGTDVSPSQACLNLVEVYDPLLGCVATPSLVQFDIWDCSREDGNIGWFCTWTGPAVWCPVRLITDPNCIQGEQHWSCYGWDDITNYSCVLAEGVVCGTLGGGCIVGDRPDIGYASCFRTHIAAPWTCPESIVRAFECDLPSGLIPGFTDRAFCWSQSVLP